MGELDGAAYSRPGLAFTLPATRGPSAVPGLLETTEHRRTSHSFGARILGRGIVPGNVRRRPCCVAQGARVTGTSADPSCGTCDGPLHGRVARRRDQRL